MVRFKRHFRAIFVIALTILAPAQFVSADTLTVVDETRPTGKIPRFALAREKALGECENELAILPQRVEDGIGKANAGFAVKRGWTAEFIATRMDIARQYWKQSDYRIIHDSENNNEVVAVIAMTWARYNAANMPDPKKTAAENRAAGHQILPEEETLENVILPRPLDSTGRGMIVELRAYYIDPSVNRRIRRYVHQAAIEMMDDAFKDYPGMREENVVHTYNDKPGLRLYAPFGMKLIEEITPAGKPLPRKGTDWYTISTSPLTIMENTIKLLEFTAKKYFAAYDLPKDMNLKLPFLGAEITAMKGSDFVADYAAQDAFFTLAQPAVLAGRTIPAGSRVRIRAGKIEKIQLGYRP